MRLAEFIRKDMEAILVEWERFAATLLPGKVMDSLALRDHAREILTTIATDMVSAQTRDQQVRKSQGLDDGDADSAGPAENAAQTHARLRAQSAFDIIDTVAEYRALRASVLRLWKDAHDFAADDFEDMLRFNESIDQAITESVVSFESHVEHTRNLLLGMIGHDMRSPLGTIQATADLLSRLDAGKVVAMAAARLGRSSRSLKTLVDDLQDFNRTRFGLGIRIHPDDVDLARLAEDEVDQLRAAYPGRSIALSVDGDTRGQFDADRMQQLLRNLISNALTHGASNLPVEVSLSATVTEVALAVTNGGAAIDPARMPSLFDPLVGGGQHGKAGVGSLGLGLYIVREIATVHGGRVEVQSDAWRTRFTATVPKAGA